MANYLTRQWHWQSTTVIGKVTCYRTIGRTEHIIAFSSRCSCSFSLTSSTLTVGISLAFGSHTICLSLTRHLVGTSHLSSGTSLSLFLCCLSSSFLLFCLTNSTLTSSSTLLLQSLLTCLFCSSLSCSSTSSSFLTSLLGSLSSSTSGSLCLCFTLFRLCNTARILSSGSLCSGFLTCQFFCTLLSSSGTSGSLRLCFCYSTFARLLYFNLNKSVNLCIQSLLLLTTLCDNTLQHLLVVLQRTYNRLLFNTLTLHLSMYLTVFIEKITLIDTHLFQLCMLFIYLHLLCLELFTLRTLIGSILTYETKTTIHLGQVLCREDEHQLVLNTTMTCHVTHRTDETSTTFTQL